MSITPDASKPLNDTGGGAGHSEFFKDQPRHQPFCKIALQVFGLLEDALKDFTKNSPVLKGMGGFFCYKTCPFKDSPFRERGKDTQNRESALACLLHVVAPALIPWARAGDERSSLIR